MLFLILSIVLPFFALGVIPWIIAAVVKKPTSGSWYKKLCIVFAVYSALGTYTSSINANQQIDTVILIVFSITWGIAEYWLLKTIGFSILKKRGKLETVDMKK
jgi:quinol-cytochrome oxidoreductase complex cytochrome b subunit